MTNVKYDTRWHILNPTPTRPRQTSSNQWRHHIHLNQPKKTCFTPVLKTKKKTAHDILSPLFAQIITLVIGSWGLHGPLKNDVGVLTLQKYTKPAHSYTTISWISSSLQTGFVMKNYLWGTLIVVSVSPFVFLWVLARLKVFKNTYWHS